MKLLLDTCALLWLGADPSRLTLAAREAMVSAHGEIHVSAISALEIAVKHAKHRLDLPVPPDAWYPRVLSMYGLREVPVTGSIALRAPQIDLPHADPADRIIASTAALLDLVVVTSDAHLRACPAVTVVW